MTENGFKEKFAKLIAAMCNDGVMTIRTLDENGNELTRSLSKSEPEARKQVNKA